MRAAQPVISVDTKKKELLDQWCRRWIRGDLGVLHEYKSLASSRLTESGSRLMGSIDLDTKRTKAQNARNPHAACEVAMIGNGITDDPTRGTKGETPDTDKGVRDCRASPRSKQQG